MTGTLLSVPRTPHYQRRYDPRRQPYSAALTVALDCFQSGRFSECLTRCAMIEADHGPQPWTQMLAVLILKDRANLRDEALEGMAKVVQQWPGWLDAQYNLGAFLQELGRWNESLFHLHRAHSIDATHVPTLVQLGITYQALGEPQRALHYWTDALQYQPTSVRDEYQLSPVFAGLGHMREFMRLQELRWEAQQSYQFDHGAPANVMEHAQLWTGDDLAGHDVLVLDEQGAGDTIQFLRYLPALCDEARSVTLRLKQAHLARLIHAVEPRVTIIPHGQPLPLVSRVVGLLSLFHRLCIVRTAATPFPQHYVPRPEKKDGGGEYAVGLCWAGATSHPRDAQRSLQPADVTALLDALGDVPVLDLTVGRAALDRPNVTALVPGDYLDTVAALDRCARIITVDTSVAHLAGAIGIPTHVMVTTLPDMRWGLEGDRTPWYDSWTLVRQTRPNAWAEPIATVTA